MPLPWIPKIVYSGTGSPLVLSFPQEMWTPAAQDVGGSRTTGSGVTESFLVNRYQLCTVNLCYFESERQSVETFLAWASANASTPFDYYFDQNNASTKYSCFLQTPVPGNGKSTPARHDFKRMYREQLTIRAVSGSPFTIKFFADVDPAVVLAIAPASLTGTTGGTQQLTIEIDDVTGTPLLGRAITFVSSNIAVASVDSDGTVSYLGAGSALITVTSGSVSSSVAAVVSAPVQQPVASVVVGPASFTVAPGATLQLAAQLFDVNGVALTGRPVVWTSSDTSKAVVDQNGLVTGLGTGGSQGAGVVSDRQDISPHYPDWNLKYTDFYYGWTPAERDWAAKHNDSQMSGDPAAFRTPNPTGQHSNYSLLWTTINSGTGSSITDTAYFGAMATWYADPTKNTTAGVYERAFLHYKDGAIKTGSAKAITKITAGTPAQLTITAHGYTSGQRVATTNMSASGSGLTSTVYASGMIVIDANTISVPSTATTTVTGSNLGQISNALGDGSLATGNRKTLVIFSSNRWLINFSDPALRAFQLYRAQQLIIDPQTGVFWDELDSADMGNGYLSVEYPTANTAGNGGPYNNSLLAYFTDLQTCLNTIRTTISPKQQWMNPAAYFTFHDDMNNVNAAGFGHLELTMRSDWSNDTPTQSSYQQLWGLSNQPGFEIVSAYTWADGIPAAQYNTPGTSGAYTSKLHREKGSCFTQALLVYPPPSADPYFRRVYINESNAWSYAPSTATLAMWDRNHGRPIVPTFGVDAARHILTPPTTHPNRWTYDSTTLDSLGAAVTIIARETDQALILYRHCNANPADHAATINLPASLTLSLLKEDGSLGPTITSVPLCGGEGVILIKTTAPVSGGFTITASSGGRNGSSAGTVGAQTVATVTLTPTATQNLGVGATVQYTATAKDGNGVTIAGAVFSWSSSAPPIASVTASGIVKGVAAGNAVITASTQGHSAVANVTVTAAGQTITTITVAPLTANVTVGATLALVPTVLDQNGAVMTGQAVTWSSNNGAVATVNAATGVVTGVATGTAVITAAAGGKTGTATMTIMPVSGGSFNEPSGMTAIVTRVFDTKNEGGFVDVGTIDTAKFIVPITNSTDAAIGTPPVSGPNVLKLFYPGGSGRGTVGSVYSPGSQAFVFYPPQKQMYLRFAIRLSAPWSNHSSGRNRLGVLYMGGNIVAGLVMAGASGAANAEMLPSIIVGGFPSPDPVYNGHTLAANVNATTFITRGVWHTLEYRVVANTPGVKDGIAETWCDGVKIVRATDVQWVSSGQDQYTPEFDLAPLWGGALSGTGSGNLAQDVDVSIADAAIYLDNLYISGKTTLTP